MNRPFVITYCETEYLSPGILYADVVFLIDFGSFKKGEELENIEIDLIVGEITEHDDEGKVSRKTSFKLLPVESIDP